MTKYIIICYYMYKDNLSLEMRLLNNVTLSTCYFCIFFYTHKTCFSHILTISPLQTLYGTFQIMVWTIPFQIFRADRVNLKLKSFLNKSELKPFQITITPREKKKNSPLVFLCIYTHTSYI